MTSRIWLWVQWVHQLSYYFCLCKFWKFCWTAVYPLSLRNWSHRKYEQLKNCWTSWLTAAVNQQTLECYYT